MDILKVFLEKEKGIFSKEFFREMNFKLVYFDIKVIEILILCKGY